MWGLWELPEKTLWVLPLRCPQGLQKGSPKTGSNDPVRKNQVRWGHRDGGHLPWLLLAGREGLDEELFEMGLVELDVLT